MEWRLEHKRIVCQKRTGTQVEILRASAALTLTFNRESDGDAWYTLAALSESSLTSPGGRLESKQRTLASAPHDSAVPQQLGMWLAHRTGVSFSNRSSPLARAQDLSGLKNRLAASGRLGRWVANSLDRRTGTAPR